MEEPRGPAGTRGAYSLFCGAAESRLPVVVSCSQLVGSRGKAPRLRDLGAGRLAPRVPAVGWARPGRARHTCVTGWAVAPSLLQSRAQPQGFTDGTAHPPFGPLGPP